MAVGMEERQVAGAAVPSIPIDMVDFHDIAAHEMQAAMCAAASLPFQQGDNPLVGQRIALQVLSVIGPLATCYLPTREPAWRFLRLQ